MLALHCGRDGKGEGRAASKAAFPVLFSERRADAVFGPFGDAGYPAELGEKLLGLVGILQSVSVRIKDEIEMRAEDRKSVV